MEPVDRARELGEDGEAHGLDETRVLGAAVDDGSPDAVVEAGRRRQLAPEPGGLVGAGIDDDDRAPRIGLDHLGGDALALVGLGVEDPLDGEGETGDRLEAEVLGQAFDLGAEPLVVEVHLLEDVDEGAGVELLVALDHLGDRDRVGTGDLPDLAQDLFFVLVHLLSSPAMGSARGLSPAGDGHGLGNIPARIYYLRMGAENPLLRHFPLDRRFPPAYN